MWMYSLIWTIRNVIPSSSVVSRPARSANRFSAFAPCSAQCIVSDDEMSTAVLTPAIRTGRPVPAAGQSSFATTRKKKYAVKNAPKSITSEMMKSSIPSIDASTRDDWLAAGGP